ncbi:MAG: SDR family oxidoreductase [Melioribacteraceae bacterium]|nr:SDR family oxidoreductase [Melioribacteraceae bacterium]
MTEKSGIIWVTGASSGIGKAVVDELINKNKKVVASSRNISNLKELIQQNNIDKEMIELVSVDVADSDSVEKAYKDISSGFNVVCLINNAGVTSFKPAEENSLSEIDNIIKTNLLGSVYTIKSVLPGMIKRKSGLIINVISVAALKVFTNSSAYAASKAGLLAYTKVLREEVRKYNIRVVNIIPGATKTPIWPNDSLEKYSDRMMSPGDIATMISDIVEIKSNLVPEEIVIRPVKGDL